MDLKGIGQGLIGALVLACLIVVFVFWAVMYLLTDSSIRSTERIEPQIELIINNNQVDTLFVYELK